MTEPYRHTVQYYETDKMKVVHHSNYIRWMEEARVYYLDMIGWSFKKLEDSGLVSPVVSVSGKFRTSAEFTDVILVNIYVTEVKGASFVLKYRMYRESDGAFIFEGESVHCFTHEDGKFVRLERELPGLFEELKKQMAEEPFPA
ncbi:thioesterase family protein [Ruminococcus sp. HUN007]|uniref:acyl-CoA thioesterase n=1 Tax=Ruminococcus sp. HUN007 TaxID=1514668 RepID=UPI0012DDB794|nr:thioesterase family protein [Ruminococcus sp. HUN007]